MALAIRLARIKRARPRYWLGASTESAVTRIQIRVRIKTVVAIVFISLILFLKLI